MPRVALKTKKRHGRIQEIVIDRTVRRMASGAILSNIAVFEGKRPLLFHVAAGAKLLGSIPLKEMGLNRSVGIVAIGAGHFLLPQRVVREEAVLRLNLGMATVAELRGLFPRHFLPCTTVELVAVEAPHVVQGVDAPFPVGKGRNRRCSVTFEANERLGRSWKIVDIEKCFRVAFYFLLVVGLNIIPYLFYGEAPRTMARLAVHERLTCLGLNLFSMDAVLEIVGYLFVLVTL
jgi:hypothetical protein